MTNLNITCPFEGFNVSEKWAENDKLMELMGVSSH